MKMSETNYKRFTDFYNYVVEKGDDSQVNFIMDTIVKASKLKTNNFTKDNFNVDNPLLDPHNAEIIREFFEDFLAHANDNDAIYLIEGLKSLCKEATEHGDKVMKFIKEKKLEAAKNAKKD